MTVRRKFDKTKVDLRVIVGTEDNLDDLIIKESPLILCLSSSSCGVCKKLDAVIEQLASENTDMTFVRVDVDKEQGVIGGIVGEIDTIPSTVVFIDESVQRIVPGCCSKDGMDSIIKDIIFTYEKETAELESLFEQ